MNKGNCASCGRKIQKTIHEKCMYCGKALNLNQAFSKEEKEQIDRDKGALKKELHNIEMERQRSRRRSTNPSVSDMLGGFEPDDFL